MRWWHRDVAGIGVCVALALLGMQGERVPVLGAADLGFHELGHLVGYVLDAALPWPEVVTAALGSVAQVGVPVGLAYYFWSRRSDRLGTAFCLAWAATSTADVARYVADAPYERLPLLGGKHDWATILGPEHLDRLSSAHELAAGLDRLAWALLLGAFAVPLWGLVTYGRRHEQLHLLRHRRP